jgi:putative FmdB family regulatory protein
MPLYEYECRSCRERTEAIQSFSEPPLTVCPKCGGALVKLLSAPAVQFKGAGWYVTDYGRSGAQDGEKKEASKGEGGKGGGEAAASEGASRETEKTGDPSKGNREGTPGAAPAKPTGERLPTPSKKKKKPAK